MRLLKVLFATVILSLSITLVLSLINYIPASKREPNVYYFSIGESFFFGIIYITPILLMVSILAFIIYVLIEKLKRFSSITNVVLSLLVAVSITSLTLFFMNKSDETDNIYLIPEGYEGDVYAFYNVEGAPMVETEDGYEVLVMNEKGYFLTSKPDMDYGTVTDKYYYVDKKGYRTPISNKCVSLFGTSGSTKFVDDEEIEFLYTGFKLTKDHCGDEFMLERHGMGENVENIIREILKDHYGVEQDY